MKKFIIRENESRRVSKKTKLAKEGREKKTWARRGLPADGGGPAHDAGAAAEGAEEARGRLRLADQRDGPGRPSIFSSKNGQH